MTFKHLCWLCAGVCAICSAGMDIGDGDPRIRLAFTLASVHCA